MSKEKFFKKMIEENSPNANKLSVWWECKKYEIWLKLPTGRGKETNLDFINQIPNHD